MEGFKIYENGKDRFLSLPFYLIILRLISLLITLSFQSDIANGIAKIFSDAFLQNTGKKLNYYILIIVCKHGKIRIKIITNWLESIEG